MTRSKGAGATKRLRGSKGFTLTELLCVTVVLILVSAAMALGITLSTRSFTRSVSSAEAQVLCSTLTTAVSDELRYAGSIQVDGAGQLSFFSKSRGKQSSFGYDEKGQITLGDERLISAASYAYQAVAELAVTYDAVRGVFTVTLLVKDGDGVTLAENQFQVQPLN